MTFLKRFAFDETGATAMEYGLIIALLAVTLIFGATLIGNETNGIFATINSRM
jgi:pilus assembly protein Flp/PilA